MLLCGVNQVLISFINGTMGNIDLMQNTLLPLGPRFGGKGRSRGCGKVSQNCKFFWLLRMFLVFSNRCSVCLVVFDEGV